MKKAEQKMIVDIAMLLTLFILMGYMYTEQRIHEWAGVVMFILFLLHNGLNRFWYKALKRGTWNLFRCLQTFVNTAVLACMLILILSGMVMSNFVFPFIDLKNYTSLAREAHLFCSYWMFLLVSVHFGLHMPLPVQAVKRRLTTAQQRILKPFVYMSASLAIILGVYNFMKHNLLDYMLLKTKFVFWNYEQSVWSFYLEYVTMLWMAAQAGHGVAAWYKKRNIRRK